MATGRSRALVTLMATARDILWRCVPVAPATACGEAAAGTTAIWTFSQGSYSGTTWPGALDFNWQIQGVGDFDGNGESDILWRCTPQSPGTACGNVAAGTVAIWQFSNGNYGSTTWPGAVDSSWQIRGIGDFDGNHKSDILWRNSDGSNSIWYDGNGATSVWPPALDVNWQIQGIGDFDGNKNSDILWRCVPQSGVTTCGAAPAWATAIWLFSDGLYATTIFPGALDFNWQIQGVSDFDNNGNSDILWRCSPHGPGNACGNAAVGSVAIWQFSGGSVSGTAWPGALDTNWQIQGVGRF